VLADRIHRSACSLRQYVVSADDVAEDKKCKAGEELVHGQTLRYSEFDG
jgi:hypothetical protein